jgi:L-asparagine oxygenase
LILMCLRNEDRVPTGICFVEQVCQRFTPEELALLMSPSFFIFPPESSLLKEPRVDAILAQRGNELISRFNRDKCKGKTVGAQAVLDKFAVIADELACEVVLNAGDALIFDNKAVLHRRRSFEAKYDGTDRWLQRVYCKAKNKAKNIGAELIRDLAISGGI